MILVSRRPDFHARRSYGRAVLSRPCPRHRDDPRGQIKVATLVAAAESLIKVGDRILCLTGIDGSGTIDTIIVIDMGTEIEMFSAATADPLPQRRAPGCFRATPEPGQRTRRGRTRGTPVGTLFVVGDSDRVLSQSHQLVFNPFHGYPEDDRNILDPRLEETVKEFSAIDGAFVLRGDGVVLSAAATSPHAASSNRRCPRGWAPGTRPPRPSP